MTVGFSREALYAEAAVIRAHPNFALAMRRHTDMGLTVVDGHPVVAKLICQTSRYATMALILCLHDLSESGEAPTGATVSQVLAAIGRTPFASISWAKLMVRVFHRAGLIEYAPQGSDRRARPFYPTPRLMSMGQDSITIFLEALAFVRPLPAAPRELATRPGLMTGFARVVIDTYLAHRFSMLEPFPVTDELFKRDFGYLIFAHLLQTMRPDGAGGITASAPAGELSRRYGVSRGSVRNFLDLCARRGLVTLDSKAGHVVSCTPMFIDLAQHWVATDLAWLSYLLDTTLARIGTEDRAAA